MFLSYLHASWTVFSDNMHLLVPTVIFVLLPHHFTLPFTVINVHVPFGEGGSIVFALYTKIQYFHCTQTQSVNIVHGMCNFFWWCHLHDTEISFQLFRHWAYAILVFIIAQLPSEGFRFYNPCPWVPRFFTLLPHPESPFLLVLCSTYHSVTWN